MYIFLKTWLPFPKSVMAIIVHLSVLFAQTYKQEGEINLYERVNRKDVAV